MVLVSAVEPEQQAKQHAVKQEAKQHRPSVQPGSVRPSVPPPPTHPPPQNNHLSEEDQSLLNSMRKADDDFKRSTKSASTLRGRSSIINRFTDFLKVEKNENRDLYELPSVILDMYICIFIEQAKKQDGDQYQSGCLQTMVSNLINGMKSEGVSTSELIRYKETLIA